MLHFLRICIFSVLIFSNINVNLSEIQRKCLNWLTRCYKQYNIKRFNLISSYTQISQPLPAPTNLKVQFPDIQPGNDCMFLYNSALTGVLSVQEGGGKIWPIWLILLSSCGFELNNFIFVSAQHEPWLRRLLGARWRALRISSGDGTRDNLLTYLTSKESQDE